jgi:hypothetical protein
MTVPSMASELRMTNLILSHPLDAICSPSWKLGTFTFFLQQYCTVSNAKVGWRVCSWFAGRGRLATPPRGRGAGDLLACPLARHCLPATLGAAVLCAAFLGHSRGSWHDELAFRTGSGRVCPFFPLEFFLRALQGSGSSQPRSCRVSSRRAREAHRAADRAWEGGKKKRVGALLQGAKCVGPGRCGSWPRRYRATVVAKSAQWDVSASSFRLFEQEWLFCSRHGEILGGGGGERWQA